MKLSKLILALMAVAFVSCADPAERNVKNIEEFVAEVEANCDSYTLAEWESIDAEFERLRAEVEANYDTMTPEQREAAMKAIGAYYGAQTRQGIQNLMDEAKKVFETLPSFIEGFGEGFKQEE